MSIKSQEEKTPKLYVFVTIILCLCIFNTTDILMIHSFEIYIFIIMLLTLFLFSKGFPKKIFKIFIVWIILIFYLFISSYFSIDPERSIAFTIYFLLFFIIMFLLSIDGRWTQFFIKFSFLFSLILLIFTIFSIVNTTAYISMITKFFSGDKLNVIINLTKSGQYPGFTKQTGYNAFFLSVGMGIIISRVMSGKQTKINLVLIIVFILTIFATGKRSFLLSNFIAIVFLLFLGGDKKISKLKSFILLIITTLASYLLSVSILGQLRIFEKFSKSDISSGRFDLYKTALDYFWSNPLRGTGINTYTIYENMEVHNIYLQLFVEIGLLGGVLFLVTFILMFIKSVKVYKMYHFNGIDLNEKFEILTSLYIQIVFLVYSFLGNPLYDMNLFLAYLIFCAISLTKSKVLNKV